MCPPHLPPPDDPIGGFETDVNEIEEEESQQLGIVVAQPRPPNHLECYIMIHKNLDLTVGTFVEIPIGSSLLIGKIAKIEAYNPYYSDPEFLHNLMNRNLSVDERFDTRKQRYKLAQMQIMRVYRNNKLFPPEIPPEPGEQVFFATKKTLELIFGHFSTNIFLGNVWKTKYPFYLDLTKVVTEHVLVVGRTGSGKSYTTAVLIEEILDQGLPVVVLDLHGEYESFAFPNKNLETSHSEATTNGSSLSILQQLKPQKYNVLRVLPDFVTPPKDTKVPTTTFNIRFDTLSAEQISEMTEMTSTAEDLLYLTISYLTNQAKTEQKNPEWDITTFQEALTEVGKEWSFHKNTIVAAQRRLAQLENLKLFGDGTPIQQFLEPFQLTIFDLSVGMRERVRRAIAGYIAQQLFHLRTTNQYQLPIVLVVEEAHRFIPSEKHLYSTRILQRIAREGRKFGIGLIIVTQMLRNLNPTIIAQCGTKIVLQIHNQTDLNNLIPNADIIDTNEIQLIPYLPKGIAFVSGSATKFPAMVEIRPRKTYDKKVLLLEQN